MASVEELLAAAKSEQSPFLSLVQGAAQGFGSAQNNALERTKALMALDQARQEQAQQAQMQKQMQAMLSNQTEAQTQDSFKSVGGAPQPVVPIQKFERTIKQDEKGKYSIDYKIKEPKEVSYQKAEYADAQGKNRVGRFNPVTGKTEQSPDDPFAPKPASDFSMTYRQDQADQRDASSLGRQLNSDHDLVNARQKINNVKSAMALYAQAKAQPGGVDQRQMVEMAISTVKTLMNSNAVAESTIQSMVPETYKGNLNKFWEKVTNEPTGIDAQQFLERYADTLRREQSVAQKQLETGFNRATAPHRQMLKRNPDIHNDLRSAWFPADETPAPAASSGGATHRWNPATEKVEVIQ